MPLTREAHRLWMQRWRAANPEKVRTIWRKSNAKRKKKICAKMMEAYRRDKEKSRAALRERYLRNKEQTKEHRNARYREAYAQKYSKNPIFRLIRNCRSRISQAIRESGQMKPTTALKLFGCEKEFLLAWLEAGFKPGMSWNNYGQRGWSVDHIKPCTSFDLSDPIQLRQCFHFTNLQPLWASENMSKGRHLPTSP